MRKDKICRRAITRLISSVLTFAIACMVVGTAVLPLSVAADELGEKTDYGLNSNVVDQDNILLHEYDGTIYISINDLCSLTRCKSELNGQVYTVKQGFWSVTFDFGRQQFSDGWQTVKMDLIHSGTYYLVPAIRFLTYFGANATIDRTSKTLYCYMTECTAWEAMSVDYKNTLINIYDLYGGENGVALSLTLDILMDYFLNGVPNSEDYARSAYKEALSIELCDLNAIKEYQKASDDSLYDYLISDKGQDAAQYAADLIGDSALGVEYLCESYYNTTMLKFADLVKDSYEAGFLDESAHYAEQILNDFRKKNTISDIAKSTKTPLAQAALVLIQAALESAQQLKYVTSTNNLVYHVMGEENAHSLGLDTDSVWYRIANTYKDTSTTVKDTLLRSAMDYFRNQGWDKLNANHARGTIDVNEIIYSFSKNCAVLFAKSFPPTRETIESIEADRNALYLSELQREVADIISKIDITADYENKVIYQKYIEAELLYCRVSIAMYQNLITTATAEGWKDRDDWCATFQKRIDLLAISLYQLTAIMDDGIDGCLPLDVSADQFIGKPLTETELLAITESSAGRSMEKYVYTDMDHDGANELIGVCRDDMSLYQTWYCSSDGKTCEMVHKNDKMLDLCKIELLNAGDATHVVLNAYASMGTEKNYSIIAMKNQKVICLISNQYGYVSTTEDGDITLNVEAYDGMYDPSINTMTVHTWKNTYLFFDGNTYKEYGATEISEREFLSYQNSQELMDRIKNELWQSDTMSLEFSYFRRKNGILHIQCNLYSDSGKIQYGYYTIKYSGNRLSDDPGCYCPGQMARSFSGLTVVY